MLGYLRTISHRFRRYHIVGFCYRQYIGNRTPRIRVDLTSFEYLNHRRDQESRWNSSNLFLHSNTLCIRCQMSLILRNDFHKAHLLKNNAIL